MAKLSPDTSFQAQRASGEIEVLKNGEDTVDRWLYLLFSEVDFARLKRLPKDSFLFLDQNRKQQYFIALKIMQMRHPR